MYKNKILKTLLSTGSVVMVVLLGFAGCGEKKFKLPDANIFQSN